MEKHNTIKKGEDKTKYREVLRKVYFEICPKCKKEIKGSSPASAKNNLKIHLLTQHYSKQQDEKE